MKTGIAFVAGAILISALVLSAVGAAASEPRTVDGLEIARDERLALGLPADDETLERLVGTPRDVGSRTFGIVMTADEMARIDLDGRMAFESAVSDQVVAYARSLPSFAGAYIDADAGGELMILLTARDPQVEAAIRARMPQESRGLHFGTRSRTDGALRVAAASVPALWAVRTSVVPHQIGVDVEAGGLYVQVAPTDLDRAHDVAAQVSRVLDTPLVAVGETAAVDTACTSRDNCVSPMRVGARIYKGVIDSYNECTMAFHIVVLSGTDVQFVTAGHCGYGGSNNWLHPGLPSPDLIGTEQATLYAPEGQDIMRVSMLASQESDLIIDDPRQIDGYHYPLQGETACASRGKTDIIDCGNVSATWVRWYSDTAGYYVWGGDTTGIGAIAGDSGSPVYHRASASVAVARAR